MWANPRIQVLTHKTKPSPVISGITLHRRFLPKAQFCLQSLNAIREESELSSIETKIVEYSEDITELFNVLMTLEMQLVEQLEVRWAGCSSNAGIGQRAQCGCEGEPRLQ